MWTRIGLIAVAGALGTLARVGLNAAVQQFAGKTFPWSTFTVNAAGCLLFGLVWTLPTERYLSQEHKLIVLAGFMGAFTTFSTYAFESVQLAEHGQWLPAAGNLLGQVALGVTCVMLGMALGRYL